MYILGENLHSLIILYILEERKLPLAGGTRQRKYENADLAFFRFRTKHGAAKANNRIIKKLLF
jgi:hypothetical protein